MVSIFVVIRIFKFIHKLRFSSSTSRIEQYSRTIAFSIVEAESSRIEILVNFAFVTAL